MSNTFVEILGWLTIAGTVAYIIYDHFIRWKKVLKEEQLRFQKQLDLWAQEDAKFDAIMRELDIRQAHVDAQLYEVWHAISTDKD